MDAYIARYDVPVNPLLQQGYGVGRLLAVHPADPAGEDPRAGRWPMFDKTECGLHDRLTSRWRANRWLRRAAQRATAWRGIAG